MKKMTFIPVVAVVLAVLLSFTMSSFRGEPKRPVFANTYFKFDVNSLASEANLENVSKWQVVTLPGSNPCTEGSIAPCIVHADNTAAGISVSDDDATRISKFVTYLQGQASAQTYVSNNYDYRRP